MADIELVIKIPEEIRLALINNIPLSLDQQSICDSCIKQAVINGTLLPKGHGDLKRNNMYTPRKDTVGDDPMIGIVWYNGLDDIVIKWKDYKKDDDVPYYAYEPGLNNGDYRQLEMVWMYLVLCFGDYGTSPRSGWIEDFDGYRKWFEELEELREPI